MIKRILLLGTSVVLLAGPATAADALSDVFVSGPSAYDWTGFYAGIVGGGGMFSSSATDSDEDIIFHGGPIDMTGWGGSLGATAGANFQSGSVVWGIEGDVNWASLGTSFYDNRNGSNIDINWDWYATIRARGGIAVDNTLFFATAGLAIAGLNATGLHDGSTCEDLDSENGFCVDETQFGLALGGGVEHAVADNITVKLEGMWLSLPTHIEDGYTYEGQHTINSGAMLARAGVNVHF